MSQQIRAGKGITPILPTYQTQLSALWCLEMHQPGNPKGAVITSVWSLCTAWPFTSPERQFPWMILTPACSAVRTRKGNTWKQPGDGKHTRRPGVQDDKAIPSLTKVALDGLMLPETS